MSIFCVGGVSIFWRQAFFKAQKNCNAQFSVNKNQSDSNKLLLIEFLKKFGLEEFESWRAIKKCPRLLTRQNLKKVEFSTDWFEKNLEFTKPEIKKILHRYPTAFLVNIESVQSRVNWWQTTFCRSKQQMKGLLMKFPGILNFRSIGVGLKLDFYQTEYGCSTEQIERMIQKAPQISGLKIYEHVQPKLSRYEAELKLTKEEMKTVIVRKPELIGLSAKNMWEKIKWLQETFGVPNEEIKQLIIRYPIMFTYSLEENLKPKVAFFLTERKGPPPFSPELLRFPFPRFIKKVGKLF